MTTSEEPSWKPINVEERVEKAMAFMPSQSDVTRALLRRAFWHLETAERLEASVAARKQDAERLFREAHATAIRERDEQSKSETTETTDDE